MSNSRKDQVEILEKLNIEELNPMQVDSIQTIRTATDVILCSPTGTGKTIAFLLPIIESLNNDCNEVQVLILVPSRELAIQIEQVARNMGSGFKINAVYGGRPISKDKMELAHEPAILIGTPGRVMDHLRRKTIGISHIQTLVLDEFDKSLEVGFEDEMKEIVFQLTGLKKRILTSATNEIEIPKFVGLTSPVFLDYLGDTIEKLDVRLILSSSKDKLNTLFDALCYLGSQPGIIFCNFKDSIQRISQFLFERGIDHGCFYGGLDQIDRERALIKFRNGTHHLLLATDLAARGLDIPEIKFIIHYHLPQRLQEFVHRNGRTARMKSDGTAYVIKWEEEVLPDFITTTEVQHINGGTLPKPSNWKTVFISGGRKDKISKGDIVGLFMKEGGLAKDSLGIIELKQDCAFAAVKEKEAEGLIKRVNNARLKKRKIRVYLV